MVTKVSKILRVTPVSAVRSSVLASMLAALPRLLDCILSTFPQSASLRRLPTISAVIIRPLVLTEPRKWELFRPSAQNSRPDLAEPLNLERFFLNSAGGLHPCAGRVEKRLFLEDARSGLD